MEKRKKKRGRSPAKTAKPGQGFDLGDQEGALVLPDINFNQALLDANVFACAYGYDRVAGYPSHVPVLTLVGEHSKPLQRAFNDFAQWGCENDGDVVDVQLMLKNDGSYLMAISPEVERAMHRLAPHHQLLRPLVFNMFWIKPFDTTNPILPDLAHYCRSPLAPVLISAGTADFSRHPPNLDSLRVVPDLPRLMKFDLKIHHERDDPEHWILQVGRKVGKCKDGPKPGGPISNPEECIRLRRKTIDVAFPVSRERVRRARLVGAVRNLVGFEDVGADQIEQAAINLVLSAELADGHPHFVGLGPGLRDVVWKHILTRVERADGENRIEDLEPAIVAAQVELDVTAVLARGGVPTGRAKFRTLQVLFKREGYVGG